MVTSAFRIVRFSVGVISLSYLASLVWLITWATLVPTFKGWSATAITSGSMGPHLEAGDIILTARPTRSLGPGDVIVFDNPSGNGNITHRIVARDPAGNLVTRGDANPRVDSTPVPPDSVRGVGQIVVPMIAKPVVWATTGQWLPFVATGLITLAAVLGARWALKGGARPPLALARSLSTPPGPDTSMTPDSTLQGRAGRYRLRNGLVVALAGTAILATVTDSTASFASPTQNSGSSFTAAPSFSVSFHLHNNPTPPSGATASQQDLPLDTVEPTAATLANYDTDRDAFAGLVLAKGSGLGETDTTKFQRWQHNPGSTLTLNGNATLDIWSAMKDFQAGKQGTVVAGLYDCNTSGTACTLITSGTTGMNPWPNNWQLISLNLGTVDHTIVIGRSLVIHLAVTDPSGDSLWFAYDTTTYQNILTID